MPSFTNEKVNKNALSFVGLMGMKNYATFAAGCPWQRQPVVPNVWPVCLP
jgi:hypothetical protein